MGNLEDYRKEIDSIDKELISLFEKLWSLVDLFKLI